MPPLRERPQDIPLIVGALFKESALAGRRFSDAAMKALGAYRLAGQRARIAERGDARAGAGRRRTWSRPMHSRPRCGVRRFRRHAELPDFDPAGAS
jgi:transcriptional regulator of acetoin/glycerol metabolism